MAHHQVQALSRRNFCLCCVGLATTGLAGGWLSPRSAYAEAHRLVGLIRGAAAKADITTHKVRGGVAVLEGSGGNIGVLTGKNGKVLVDAGITATRPKIAKALDDLGGQPVTDLINTHWHFDHADGNEWLHEQGAAITAHVNTKKHLMEAQRVEDWDFTFPASPAGAIPTKTVDSDQVLEVQGAKLEVVRYEAAHTDSDIGIYFTHEDILHTGDIYWNGIYPFIDYSTGGGINGTIAACEKSLKLATKNTVVIPGHGAPVSNRDELQAFRDMLAGIRDNVAKLKGQGMSVGEVVAAKPTEAYDAKWGQFVITPPLFAQLVYQGV